MVYRDQKPNVHGWKILENGNRCQITHNDETELIGSDSHKKSDGYAWQWPGECEYHGRQRQQVGWKDPGVDEIEATCYQILKSRVRMDTSMREIL